MAKNYRLILVLLGSILISSGQAAPTVVLTPDAQLYCYWATPEFTARLILEKVIRVQQVFTTEYGRLGPFDTMAEATDLADPMSCAAYKLNNPTHHVQITRYTNRLLTIEDTTADLSWTAPTQNEDGTTLDDLAGFTIYYGQEVSALVNTQPVNDPVATTATVTGLTPGWWYFAMTAYDFDTNESVQSNTVSKRAY
jgi:hypothetical protein